MRENDVQLGAPLTLSHGLRNTETNIDDGDSPYAVLDSDEFICCDTDGGAITVNLPAGVSGTHYKIANVGTSGNDITVEGDGAELVYGELNQTVRDGDVLDLNYSVTHGWW